MKLAPEKTALITLDLQNRILAMGSGYSNIIPNAAEMVEFGRKKNYRIIHVGLGFSEGHPEIRDGSLFSMAKQNNLFVRGTPSAAFHESIVKPNDLIIYKQRISAFSENHLELTLRSLGIENLILFGIATSGIVLSTVTRAFDLDFRINVIRDACYDSETELHNLLMDKVYAKRGVVKSTKEFIAEQS